MTTLKWRDRINTIYLPPLGQVFDLVSKTEIYSFTLLARNMNSSMTCLLVRVVESSTKELRSHTSLLSRELGFLFLRGLCGGEGVPGACVGAGVIGSPGDIGGSASPVGEGGGVCGAAGGSC